MQLISRFICVIGALFFAITGPVVADEPKCTKHICEAIIKDVLKTESPDILKHVSSRVCPFWNPPNVPLRKKFCATLAMNQEFFGAQVDFNRLPGRMCGDVRIHRSDTSIIVELPNLESHAPGCNCVA
jgi:hypothetical protein